MNNIHVYNLLFILGNLIKFKFSFSLFLSSKLNADYINTLLVLINPVCGYFSVIILIFKQNPQVSQYPIYVLLVSPIPKFQSVSLYHQPF